LWLDTAGRQLDLELPDEEASPEARDDRPHATAQSLLLTLDTTRPDRLECNGSPRAQPPNNAVVPVSRFGELAVYCGQAAGTAHILDVNGYFQ